MDSAQYVLMCFPEILERVFHHLPVIDVLKMQSICKHWKEHSKRVLSLKDKNPYLDVFTSVQQWEDLSPVKFNSSTSPTLLTWDKENSIYGDFVTWRDSWQGLPDIAICVCLGCDVSKKKKVHVEADKILRHWLPPFCQSLVLGSVISIVCSDKNLSDIECNVESLKRFYNIMSFPANPGSASIRILNLELSKRSCKDSFLQSLREEISCPDLRMLLVFHKARLEVPEWFLNEITTAFQKNVVIAGCLVDDPIILNTGSRSESTVPRGTLKHRGIVEQEAVVISFKGKNVHAASVIVGDNVDELTDLNSHLDRLKASVEKFKSSCLSKCKNRISSGYCKDCRSQTMGFMIACCSRASSLEWYGNTENCNYNEEQKAFRAKFPEIPLFGAFGMGEIGGCVNVNEESTYKAGSGAHNESDSSLLKAESTIFAVIMLK